MKMLSRMFVLLCACLAVIAPDGARAGVRYLSDPVYKSLNPDDPGLMDEIVALAGEGDIRAQYILGDLYTKGKGGLAKNRKEGLAWFETSARNGYPEAFIRLAAMAKRAKKPVEAYKWYTLAARQMPHGPWRKHALKAREELRGKAELTREDIAAAGRDADAWQAETRRLQREKRAAEAVRRKEELLKQKTEKEQEQGKEQEETEDNGEDQG